MSPVPSEGLYILSARQSVVPWGGFRVPQEAGKGETQTGWMPQEGIGREFAMRRVSEHARKVHV